MQMLCAEDRLERQVTQMWRETGRWRDASAPRLNTENLKLKTTLWLPAPLRLPVWTIRNPKSPIRISSYPAWSGLIRLNPAIEKPKFGMKTMTPIQPKPSESK